MLRGSEAWMDGGFSPPSSGNGKRRAKVGGWSEVGKKGILKETLKQY